MIERIKKLITDNKLSSNQFLKLVNLPNSAISEWSKGKAKPSLEAIRKIADFFDCSVDYLLGRTDNPNVITSDNIDIIAKFKALTDEERAEVISFINSLIFSREHAHVDVAAESGKRYTTSMTAEKEHKYALEQENNNK